VPFFPYLSILGILLLLFLAIYMFNYSLIAWIVTTVWIIIGLSVYKGYAAGREVEHIRKVKALERIEKKEYSIIVSIANPKTIKSLTNIAISIAKKHNGKIIFLNIIEVLEEQKLKIGLEEAAAVKPILAEAEAMAESAQIQAKSIIKVAHRISQGIVDTAVEENCNFIVLGRAKQSTFLDRVFSSLIDTVLQKSPSETAVLHGDFSSSKIKNILIPYGADIHTRLATEIAPAMVEHFNAKLKIVVVVDPDISSAKRDEKINQIQKIIDENALTAELKIIEEHDVLKAIIKESKNMDMVLMGGRSGDFLELLFAKSLAQQITEQVKCPVLWVKEYEERSSFFSSLLKPHKTIGEA
jgi:nucleotide-binding universal stress UspA family protein